jgi:hypothetical protein
VNFSREHDARRYNGRTPAMKILEKMCFTRGRVTADEDSKSQRA